MRQSPQLWRPVLPVLALVALLLLSNCTDGSRLDLTPGAEGTIPIVEADEDGVYAEGRVVPAHSVTLRAPLRGTINAVEIEEGDAVAAGDWLLQFDTIDAEIAVEQAAAGLAAAAAQSDLIQAGAREEQIGVIAAQLDAAQAALTGAVARRAEITAGLSDAEILDAQAELLRARSAHENSESAHEDTMTCYEFGGQERCPALGTYEELARAQEEAAYSGLLAAQAQVELEAARVDPQVSAANAAVQSEIARRNAVEAELARAEAGARAEEIEVGAAGVRQAEAALAQARELLAQHRVDAPFDATVTDLPVHPGDAVAQGAPLATLATLDRLEIQSTDLTELDVTAIAVGQPVIVTFDAMPDQELSGTVTRIDPQGTVRFGDVLYTVTVELDETPAWVRWGMSVMIEIEAVDL